MHLGKPHSLIKYVPDRLGHDRRYAIDSSKAHAELKWKPRHQHSRWHPRDDRLVCARTARGGSRLLKKS